jgi:hypothetical protein
VHVKSVIAANLGSKTGSILPQGVTITGIANKPNKVIYAETFSTLYCTPKKYHAGNPIDSEVRYSSEHRNTDLGRRKSSGMAMSGG